MFYTIWSRVRRIRILEHSGYNKLDFTGQLYRPNLILNKHNITVEIGDNCYDIFVSELSMKREQYYTIKNKGLTKPNDDIYNVSEKADIIVKIILV